MARPRVGIDLTPIRESPGYRKLLVGRLVSILGAMITNVAFPYQMWQLTHSSVMVGLVGAAELGPLLVLALVGGAYADAFDRRRLVILSETGLALTALALVLMAEMAHPPVWALFVIAGVSSGLSGFHRPALEALIPQLVKSEHMPSVAAIRSLVFTTGSIAGPAIGGVLIASIGLSRTYAVEFACWLVSVVAVWSIPAVPPPANPEKPSLRRIAEGLRYARSRQDLLGTYLIDINAMFFGMPNALFPAIAERFGGARALGIFYAAPSVGAMLVTLVSGWTARVHRHGAAIAWAAFWWGIAIIGFGLSHSLWLGVLCLAAAGGADQVSGIFRMTIWNQTIPDALRGRLAGIEQISYMSGPLLGNVEAGLAAGALGVTGSVVSGGVLCALGTVALAALLPGFWRYDERTSPERAAKLAEEAPPTA